VPPGYTLANWRTLKELTTGSTANTQATPAVSPAAAQLLAALQSWHAGEREQALAALLKLDWQSDFRFAATDYLFTMTEAQCVSLVPDDKQQMLTAVMSQTSDIRAIARELVERAKRARAAGDHATAEQHLRTAAGLGELLDRDRDGMLIVRMVGIAVQRLAFTELAEFYEATGNADELQAARTRLADLAAESKAIKDAAAGQ